MRSSKFRFAGYFALLALLPVLAGSWAFSQVSSRGDTERVDSRLDTVLEVAVANYFESVAAASDAALRLAHSSLVQQALAKQDRAALEQVASLIPNATFLVGDTLLAGPAPRGPAARQTATVKREDGRLVGRVVVAVPLDDQLVGQLRQAAGLKDDEHLVVVSRGVAVAGPDPEHTLDLPVGTSRDVRFVGARYRVRGQIVPGVEGVSIYALNPKPDSAVRGLDSRLLLFAFGAVAFVAILAYLVGRTFRRVELEAETDPLTGLPRRRRFVEALLAEIRRVERSGGSLAVICADIDDFKTVNDRYGHEAGDDVLRRFADILRGSVREFDLAARNGGEEFAILLSQTEIVGATRLAERIRAQLAAHEIPTRNAVLSVTASFGVATFPGSQKSDLLHAADQALYRAKRSGKNRVITTND